MSRRSNQEHRRRREARRIVDSMLRVRGIEYVPGPWGLERLPTPTVSGSSALALLREQNLCFHCEGPHDPKKHAAGKARHYAEAFSLKR